MVVSTLKATRKTTGKIRSNLNTSQYAGSVFPDHSYISEVLLNHLMADDICVFCPSKCMWAANYSILEMCARLLKNRMELFSTAAKLFV